MAKEFYGYVERERPTAVNWSDVTKKITDKLEEGEKARLEERSGVISAAKELEEGIEGLKGSERASHQVFVSNVGYSLANANEALKDQMLSKEISQKDYNIAYADLKGQYNLFKSFNQNYNTSYQKYQKGVQTGDMGPVNSAAGDLLERFGQVDNLEPKFQNGRLVFQRYDGNNQPIGESMTMKDLNGLMLFKSDKFDTTTKVSNVSKAVQKASSKTSADGRTTILDPRNNPNFEKTVEDLSAAQFTDQGQISATNYLIQNNKSGYKKVNFDTYDSNDTESIFMTIKDGIISVVPEQIEKINEDAIKAFAEDVKGTLPFESVSGVGSDKGQAAVDKLKTGSDFVKSVNNVLTTGTDFQSSMSSIATTLGADDVNYELDQNGEITAYVFDFPEKSKIQRTIVNVRQNGQPISNEKITQDLYSIYQKATNDKSSFTDVWRKSNITTTTDYNPGKAEVFKADPGERDSDVTVRVGIRAVPLEEYLNRSDAKKQVAYSTNFENLGTDMPGYVPESFRGNVGVKETAENLEFSMGKRTPFRNNPVNFKIPANLAPTQHRQVIESLNKILWENPTLTRGPEFLKLFQAELDATLGDGVVDII